MVGDIAAFVHPEQDDPGRQGAQEQRQQPHGGQRNPDQVGGPADAPAERGRRGPGAGPGQVLSAADVVPDGGPDLHGAPAGQGRSVPVEEFLDHLAQQGLLLDLLPSPADGVDVEGGTGHLVGTQPVDPRGIRGARCRISGAVPEHPVQAVARRADEIGEVRFDGPVHLAHVHDAGWHVRWGAAGSLGDEDDAGEVNARYLREGEQLTGRALPAGLVQQFPHLGDPIRRQGGLDGDRRLIRHLQAPPPPLRTSGPRVAERQAGIKDFAPRSSDGARNHVLRPSYFRPSVPGIPTAPRCDSRTLRAHEWV
ncbi:hypothetical protein SCANM63S_07620 [Streptomyces canarius]